MRLSPNVDYRSKPSSRCPRPIHGRGPPPVRNKRRWVGGASTRADDSAGVRDFCPKGGSPRSCSPRSSASTRVAHPLRPPRLRFIGNRRPWMKRGQPDEVRWPVFATGGVLPGRIRTACPKPPGSDVMGPVRKPFAVTIRPAPPPDRSARSGAILYVQRPRPRLRHLALAVLGSAYRPGGGDLPRHPSNHNPELAPSIHHRRNPLPSVRMGANGGRCCGWPAPVPRAGNG